MSSYEVPTYDGSPSSTSYDASPSYNDVSRATATYGTGTDYSMPSLGGYDSQGGVEMANIDLQENDEDEDQRDTLQVNQDVTGGVGGTNGANAGDDVQKPSQKSSTTMTKEDLKKEGTPQGEPRRIWHSPEKLKKAAIKTLKDELGHHAFHVGTVGGDFFFLNSL